MSLWFENRKLVLAGLEAKQNKPNAAKGFDINRIREKGEKQTQWCYPQSHQYVTSIFGLTFAEI